jgi:4-amino-4-deoxy-L-arabinose transferase-like glycosyltransferase
MALFLRSRWVLILVLIAFIACKIPHLFYPYYWDESSPYAPAIKEMCKQGIGLLPGSLDPALSRGHPLFFHAVAALWMRLFGPSHVAMHSFALLIAVLFLIAIYEVATHLYNQRTAVFALLLAGTQLTFFIQASFVLMEIMLALQVFLTLYF